jgi:hypothetical protein
MIFLFAAERRAEADEVAAGADARSRRPELG